MFDRNITIYVEPGRGDWKEEFTLMPHPYSELAERFHVSSSFDEFDIITKYHLLGKVNTEFLSIESIFSARQL